MISILNYGMGNIRSIQNALNYIEIENNIIEKPEKIIEAEKIILPGVGSFGKAMENMEKRGIINPLNEAVLDKKIPVLGICLGMQLLAEGSEEDGMAEGFGWINGVFKKFIAKETKIKVPHVGFNEVVFKEKSNPLFKNIKNKSDFYFVHSYRLSYDECDFFSSWSEYGGRFVSSVERENIFGTQFHPEKSQSNGLTILRNFASFNEQEKN